MGRRHPSRLEVKFGGNPIPAIVENVRDGSTATWSTTQETLLRDCSKGMAKCVDWAIAKVGQINLE